MVLSRPGKSIPIQLIIKQSLIMSGFAQMGHDELVELWMCLHGEKTPGHVEPLDSTAGTVAQVDTALGHFMYDIAVHLMEIL